MTVKRREFVCRVLLAVFGLSGCLAESSSGLSDLRVSNETTSEMTVDIEVTRLSDGKRFLAETVTVDAGATKEYEEVVSGSTVRVHVSVENGPEGTSEWADAQDNAHRLHIGITTDSIVFTDNAT